MGKFIESFCWFNIAILFALAIGAEMNPAFYDFLNSLIK